MSLIKQIASDSRDEEKRQRKVNNKETPKERLSRWII